MHQYNGGMCVRNRLLLSFGGRLGRFPSDIALNTDSFEQAIALEFAVFDLVAIGTTGGIGA
jgi:hypothetical protein